MGIVGGVLIIATMIALFCFAAFLDKKRERMEQGQFEEEEREFEQKRRDEIFDALGLRYARGEITKDQYLEMKKIIGDYC